MMKVNGVDKEVDPGKGTVPIEINGRVMIPIRAVVEALGGNIGWIAEEKKITISLGSIFQRLRSYFFTQWQVYCI